MLFRFWTLDSDNHLRLQVSVTSSTFKIVQKLEQCMFKYQAGKLKTTATMTLKLYVHVSSLNKTAWCLQTYNMT